MNITRGLMDEYLTVEQVATKLQVSERTVYNWINSGKLSASKFGDNWRVTPAELEAFKVSNKAA